MGFDIECIIDIHTYPGEYFCPVCRTLVYPNEAFQSQCTHLYCKPCLAHIANGSRACPYDGYLVTESDSKPLMDSDKAMAENIGKVKVHCLYFRSGCTWEGTLSDCTSHCSECSFGNSPVICNRCGIQIVHRQVHDHAQSCPGAYEGQQAAGGVPSLTRSSTVPSAATTEVNQTGAQPGGPTSQAHNTQNVSAAPVSGQNPNLQVNVQSQALVVTPVAVPTPEQWYQQQYQQYYQQYVGYDPYQQPNQQYYPLQQQSIQQYPQHPVQMGHPQPHAFPQTQPQQPPPSQIQTQQQPNSIPQTTQQSQLQPQAQGQAQLQPQLQLLPQAQHQVPVPPQGQALSHVPNQVLVPNYQVPQQQSHPPIRPQTQVPSQTLPPPPHSHSTQPPSLAQAMAMRPLVQHAQVPQYHQPHVPMHHPQVPQAHVQPQIQTQHQPRPPQPQTHTQTSNQPHVQIQPQAQPYHTQPQHPGPPPQANHSTASALPQAPHLPGPPVSGHHSYQQPQSAPKMYSGASQQHSVHPHPASGSYPVPAHGQVPQQPGLMRPPLSHGSLSQQQPSTLLPLQNQNPGIPPLPHQHIPPHAQQLTHQLQHRSVMQPVQQAPPHHYDQQQHFPAPFPNQLHQQGQLPQQLPLQPPMRPSGPPQPPQSQNYVGRPLTANQGIHSQNHPFSTGGFGSQPHSGPAQLTSAQTFINQNHTKSSLLDQDKTVQETRSPSKGLIEKGFDVESLKEVAVSRQNETVVNDAEKDARDCPKSVVKPEDDVQGAVEQASGGKSLEATASQDKLNEKEGNFVADSEDNQKTKLSKTAGAGPSFGIEMQSHTASSSFNIEAPQKSHGSYQQRPQTQGQGQPTSVLGPEGPEILPHPGHSVNPTEGRVPGYFIPPPKSYESQSGPQGPALNALSDPRGVMGRAPPPRFEGQYGPQHVVRPSEVAMSKDQVSGSGDGGPPMRTHVDEPSFLRLNGGTDPDSSMFGSRDEKFKALPREHLNPFSGGPTHAPDQASRSLDKAPHGPVFDAGSKLDPGALGPHSRFLQHHLSGGHGRPDMFGPDPEFGQHPMKHFTRRSPDREYSSPHGFSVPSSFSHSTSAFDDINSREAHRFGEGSRPSNLSSDPGGIPFRDGRFPSFSGHPRRGENGGMGNPRFGEHMAPGMPHNQIGSDDVFGPDRPGHLMRGKYSGYLPGHFHMDETAVSGVFPSHGRMGELGGPVNYPRLPFNESVRADRLSFPHFVEPAMRNNYSLPGFPNSGNFAGGIESFDHSRKRKPVSTGWCRICSVDCENVEGLEMHSQTREHQHMALDMVKSIKLQNRKKQRTAAGMVHEGGSRSRKAGIGRGSKP